MEGPGRLHRGDHGKDRGKLHEERNSIQRRIDEDIPGTAAHFAGPEVLPSSRRKIDGASRYAGLGDGSNQKRLAEEKLGVEVSYPLILRIVPEEGPHDRGTVRRVLAEELVDVGQKAIAELQILPGDRLNFRSVAPRLLILGHRVRVVPEERGEGGALEPPGEELRRWVLLKATDVGPGKAHAAEAESEKHGNGGGEMLPPAVVVPGPYRGVALNTGVACTGQNEGAPPGARELCSATRRPAHEHAVDIVVGVLAPWPPVAVHGDRGGRGEGGAVVEVPREVGGLVHVVPDPGHSDSKERLVVSPPPLPHLGL